MLMKSRGQSVGKNTADLKVNFNDLIVNHVINFNQSN